MDTRESTDFCTTREAARMLGISLRTAQLWVENGTLEAWKTEGGHRRISIASVRRLRAAEAEPAGVETRLAEHLKVLVVEDDNILLRLYKSHLESWGLPLSVATARNGVEGLILVGRISPDLLITDLNMPEMNGFGMIRTLINTPYREGMEIVVVTGLDDAAIAAEGGLPADIRLLRKPVHFTTLRSLCEQLLARRRELSC